LDAAYGRRLVDRQPVGGAVDGAGRREDQAADAVPGHRPHEAGQATDVGVVIVERDPHRLPDRLACGEVQHGVDPVRREHLLQSPPVEEVDRVHAEQRPAGDLLDPADRGVRAVGVVVDHHDLVAVREELDAGVAADEPGAPGDQDGPRAPRGHHPRTRIA
jgi:hypothetical protein